MFFSCNAGGNTNGSVSCSLLARKLGEKAVESVRVIAVASNTRREIGVGNTRREIGVGMVAGAVAAGGSVVERQQRGELILF